MKTLNSLAPFVLPNASIRLNVETLDGSGQAAHPDIIKFVNGFRGGLSAKCVFIMAMTPYRNHNDKLENPSIVVSNLPNGTFTADHIKNPIDKSSGRWKHNADPDIVFKDGRFSLFWKHRDKRDDSMVLLRTRSSDLVRWSNREICQPPSIGKLVSPSVLFDGTWKLWGVNPASYAVDNWESSDGLDWEYCGMANIPRMLLGRACWHIDVQKVGSKFYALIVYGEDEGNVLHFGESSNGLDWTVSDEPILSPSLDGFDCNGIYRSSFIIENGKIKVWYSALGKGRTVGIGYSESEFSPAKGDERSLNVVEEKWVIRRYRSGDETGILQLFGIEGESHSLEDWRSLYAENPFGLFVSVADYGNRVIGHMSLVPARMKIGEKVVMGSQAMALLVHPNYRNRGIFLSLGEHVTEEAKKSGVPFSYGVPNAFAHKGHLKYGWFDVCNIPLFVKYCSNALILYHYLEKYRMKNMFFYRIGRFLTNRGLVRNLIKHRNGSMSVASVSADSGSVSIRRASEFDDGVDRLLGESSDDYGIAVVRDRKYLNWRYFKCNKWDGYNYEVFFAEEHGRVLGYLIAGLIKKKWKIGAIADVLVLKGRKDVTSMLVSSAMEYFGSNSVDEVTTFVLGNKDFVDVLLSNGFKLTSYVPLIARINGEGIEKDFVRNPSNWYITYGDAF